MLTRLFIALIVSCIFHALPAHADTSVNQLIGQAKVLIANNSYQEAYTLLNKEEAEFSGVALFDYYLGLTALQSGKAAEAVFALERALDTKPDFQQARAELGRAYYYLGENKAAKSEFEQIKEDAKVPGGVKLTIDKFLAAIDSRFDSSGQRLEFYIEAGVGHDSNVNSATDLEAVILPAISTAFAARLPEESQETESAFVTLKPGVRYSRPLKEDLNFFASSDVSVLDIADADEFSSQTFNLSTGLAKLAGADQYHGLISFQQYEVDGEGFRDLLAISGQWLKTLNPKNRITSYIQINDASYEDGVRDGSINSIGINWLRGSAKSVYNYGLYYGQEKIDDDLQQHQAKDFIGLKLGTKISWKQRSIFANAVYQINSFEEDDPLQLAKRDGDFISIDVGIDIPWLRKLTITPKLTITQNSTDNNLDLYDYDRTVFDITAVYTF